MSEPIVPQEVPFEESEEYKERRHAFEREMYEALVDYKRTKLDIEKKIKDDCDLLRYEYEKRHPVDPDLSSLDELINRVNSKIDDQSLRIESISPGGIVTLNRAPGYGETVPAFEIEPDIARLLREEKEGKAE